MEHIELLTAEPNWSGAYIENFEYKTDIFTAQSGAEQRRKLRRFARYSVEYDINPIQGEAVQLRRQLTFWGQYPFYAIDWARMGLTTAAPSQATTVIPVLTNGLGLAKGDVVAVMTAAGTFATFEVDTVAPDAIHTVLPVMVDIKADAQVYRTFKVWIPSGQVTSMLTDQVCSASIRLEADPMVIPPIGVSGGYDLLGGVEVCNLSHNWRNGQETTHDYTAVDIDFGRGPRERRHPVDYNTPSVKWSVQAMTKAQAEAVIAFFHRRAGRLRPCYVPSLLPDMAALPITINGMTFTTPGDAAYLYWDAAVQTAVRLETINGTVLYRRILSAKTDANGDSVFTVSEKFPVSSEVRKVSWLTLCRLSSDNLVLSWLTDSVAQCDLTFTALENK